MIRYNPSIEEGLNTSQVQYRNKYNYTNKINNIKIDSTNKIIFRNTLSYFNILNLYIAILFFLGKSYLGIIFILVILFNITINLIKEIRTRRTILKLNKLDNEFVSVIRDSKIISISKKDIVLDDIIVYKDNNIIATDSIILDGEVEVDESCLNGKKPTIKKVGDMLFTGSKIIMGKCICRADKVGDSNYLSKIVSITKNKSNNIFIKRILNNIVKYVSIIIFILSIIFYIHTRSLLTTALYIYKIMPIELYIIIALIFVLSIIKLNRKNILIKNLSSIINAKNIDTICFDKTGTLTKNSMTIDRIVVLNKKYDYMSILSSIGKYCDKSNELINIIHEKYNKKTNEEFVKEEIFTNYIKISFKGHKYYLKEINRPEYAGYKQILLASDKTEIAIILLDYEIKDKAKELINRLYKDNIDIKIISGDNYESLYNIAKKIGIKRPKFIDMSLNNTNMNHQLVEEYNVFYNVSAEQKKILINALKGNNRNVAMVGDGINDILSLNAANSSISVNNSVSMKVSDYAILDDEIDGVYNIIDISKRSFNCILKLIHLCLFKTIYSFLLYITLFICGMYSYKFNLMYEIVFLIPVIWILLNKRIITTTFREILNESIVVSILTYLLTFVLIICKFTLNINVNIMYQSIVLLILLVEFITILKFKY